MSCFCHFCLTMQIQRNLVRSRLSSGYYLVACVICKHVTRVINKGVCYPEITMSHFIHANLITQISKTFRIADEIILVLQLRTIVKMRGLHTVRTCRLTSSTAAWNCCRSRSMRVKSNMMVRSSVTFLLLFSVTRGIKHTLQYTLG